MFSPALEIVLTVAYREATVAASHASDARAPALRARARSRRRADPRRPAAPTCRSCARDLDTYLHDRSSSSRAASRKSRSRRWRSAACCRPPCCTSRARSGRKCTPATSSPPSCSRPKSHAAQLLAEQGITRLDVLEYISHGISEGAADGAGSPDDDASRRRRARAVASAAARPRAIRCRPTASNLTDRARARRCSIR